MCSLSSCFSSLSLHEEIKEPIISDTLEDYIYASKRHIHISKRHIRVRYMCRSIINNIRCCSKDKCKFAHTLDQLTLKECKYDCLLDYCKCIHSYESKLDWYRRIHKDNPLEYGYRREY
jgi:hypothetical protein